MKTRYDIDTNLDFQCSLAYHHFASIQDTTRILSTFLKPGGSLLVVDILNDGRPRDFPSSAKHVVPHQSGFSVQVMRTTFEGAGLVEFSIREATKASMQGSAELSLFLAKGVKPQHHVLYSNFQ